MLTLLCCSRITSVDVGNTACDYQFLRVGQQKAAQSKVLITQYLGISRRGVAEFFGALCQLHQLRWAEHIGKPKYSFFTEIYGFPPRKTIVHRRSPALLAADSARIAQMDEHLHFPRRSCRPVTGFCIGSRTYCSSAPIAALIGQRKRIVAETRQGSAT